MILAGQGAAQAQDYTLSANTTTAAVGETITLTIDSTYNGTFSGYIYIDGVATSNILTDPGQTTVAISLSTPGAHTVRFGLDGFPANFQSNTLTINVLQTRTLSLSVSAVSAPFNSSITATTNPSAGSGSPSYSVTGVGCSVDANGVVTASQPGACSVSATVSADATYIAATSAPVTVTFTRIPQQIVLSVASTSLYVGQTSVLSVSGVQGSGAVTYSSSAGCGISGTTLTANSAGTSSVTASVAADAAYLAATSAPVSVTVINNVQTISFTGPGSGVVGGSATLSATATSGLTVAFTSLSQTICTVAVSTVTYIAPGACIIAANQPGDGSWLAAAQVTQTVTVGAAATSISLSVDVAAPVAGAPVVLRATVTTASGSGPLTGSVTFSDGSTVLGSRAVSSGVATLTVTSLTVGVHSITAVYSGDTNHAGSTSNGVTVTPYRPNPASNPTVHKILINQVQTVQRVASLQVDIVNHRLEILHEEEVATFTNGLSLGGVANPPGLAYSPVDPTPLTKQGQHLAAVKALDKSAKPATPVAAQGKGLGPDYYIWTAGAIATAVDKIDGLPDKTRTTSQSVTVGIDTKLFAGFKAGVAFGGFTSAGKIDDVGSKDRAQAVTGTLYSSWDVGQGVFLDAALGYGDARFKSTRYDANATGLLTGSRKGDMVYGSLTASWDQKSGQLKYAPYARFDVSHAWLDKYAEQGDANWALAFDKTTIGSQSAVLGLRAQYDIANGSGTVSPMVRVEYRHAFSGDAKQSLSYVAAPSTVYGLTVDGAQRDTVTGSVGLKAQGEGALSGQIEYSVGLAMQGGGFAGQGLRGAIRLGF